MTLSSPPFPSLDTPSYQVLEVNNNVIKDFPSSICHIKTLRRISAFENKLKELPKRMGDLTNLEFLDLHSNDMKLIPKSMVECALHTLPLFLPSTGRGLYLLPPFATVIIPPDQPPF